MVTRYYHHISNRISNRISKRISKKINFIFLVLILVLPISALAQEEKLNAYPALWLVEKENSKTYFLGSVHLLPPTAKWYGGVVKNAFMDTDEVVFEVNMTAEKQREAGIISRDHGLLGADDNLHNYLNDKDYALLGEHARGLGIPPVALERFKPWLVSITLSISAVLKEGWDQNSGVDKYIQTLAAARGLKISELETIDVQMASLWDHSLEIQTQMLIDTLKEISDISNLTLAMVNSWANGDTDKMEEVFLKPMMAQEEIFDALVRKRNNEWIPVIEGLIAKKQTTFIVAGTAHFIGDEGVINLLKAKGYNVKRIQ